MRCFYFELLLTGARYFTVFECGSTLSPVACLVFKEKIHGAQIVGLHSFDGLSFYNAAGPGPSRPLKCYASEPMELIVPEDSLWSDAVLAHNLAVIRLDPASSLSHPLQIRFLVLGGMQAYTREASTGLIDGEDARFGVRLAVGNGWPPDWPAATATTADSTRRMAKPSRWTAPPRVVMHGRSPAGCVDRRLQYTGNLGCEFDGRLSVVQWRGRLHVFARANLREGALAGGRFVQTSSSADGSSGSWTSWQPISIESVPSGSADVYFFSVNVNPVSNTSLMALFPLSQPPHACIALSFSRDGRHYSRPINLRTATLGWRTAISNGSGPIEWRSESHPAAGVLLRNGEVWIYVHEGVPGVSMRPGRPRPSLRRYRMPARDFAALSHRAMRTLPGG